MDDKTFYYSSIEHEEFLGERETTTFDATMGATSNYYTGEWLKDSETRQGRGSLSNADGTNYDGFFYHNRYHGRGKLTYLTKENQVRIYKGEFETGQKHGHGTVYLSNGDNFKTRWDRNQMNK